MFKNWITALFEYLVSLGIPAESAQKLEGIIVLVIILILAFLSDYLTKKILITSIKSFVRKSKTTWDDILLERKVFNRLAHIAPALIIYYSINLAIDSLSLIGFIKTITVIYIYIVSLLVATAFINSLHDIYLNYPISKDRPIKGYVQLVIIFLYFIVGILIIALLSGESPLKLLTGLGAIAAVLLLVFRDTILGLVASIQVSANNMVKPGDWITMPSRNTDGTVLEISLNTVKVQNWDKTISNFPTYALSTESFHNWKGMEDSGGRRIKRSINIDMKSVKFLDEELKKKLRKVQNIKTYIEEREKEIEDFNKNNKVDPSIPINGRRMTNLGVFRRYLEAYLKNHPKVNPDMTFLIRHLQPTDKGLPIEIYIFSKEKEWAVYESVQADIFDHVLAAIPIFDLKVYQDPTGDDFRKLIEG
jgi:miniconductance mechanosensitive channel